MRILSILCGIFSTTLIASNLPNEAMGIEKRNLAYSSLDIVRDVDDIQFIQTIEPFLSMYGNGNFEQFWQSILWMIAACATYHPHIAAYLASTPHLHLPFDQPEAMANAFLFGAFLFGFHDETLQRKWMERFTLIAPTSPTGKYLNACFEKCQDAAYLQHCLENTEVDAAYRCYTSILEQIKMPLEQDQTYQLLLSFDKDRAEIYRKEKEAISENIAQWPVPSKDILIQQFQNNLNTLRAQSPKQYNIPPRQIEIDETQCKMKIVLCTGIDQNGPHTQTFDQPSKFKEINQLFWTIVKDDIDTFEKTLKEISQRSHTPFEDIIFDHLCWDIMTPIIKYNAVKIFESLKEKDFFFKHEIIAPTFEPTLHAIIACPSPEMQKTYLEHTLCLHLWAQYKLANHLNDILQTIDETNHSPSHKTRTKECFKATQTRLLPQGYTNVFLDPLHALQTRENHIYEIRMEKLVHQSSSHTIIDTFLQDAQWTFEKIGASSPKLRLLCASMEAKGTIELPSIIEGLLLEECDLSLIANNKHITHLILPETLKYFTLYGRNLPHHLKKITFRGPPPLERRPRFYKTKKPPEPINLNCTISYPQKYAAEWENYLKTSRYRTLPANTHDE